MAKPGSHQIELAGTIAHAQFAPLTATIAGSLTSTTPITLVTPSSTQKVRLYGGEFQGVVTTVLASTIGWMIVLYEETAGTIFEILGVIAGTNLVAGSSFPGSQTVLAYAPTATIYNTGPAAPYRFGMVPNTGKQTATAGKKLNLAVTNAAGAVQDLSTGVIACAGFISYDLV